MQNSPSHHALMQNQFPTFYWHTFLDSQSLCDALITVFKSNPLTNHESQQFIIDNDKLILIQKHGESWENPTINDSQFIDLISIPLSNHDIDPIQYHFSIYSPSMDTQVFVYQLISINP